MLLKKQTKSGPLDQSKNESRQLDHWSRSQRHDRYFEKINKKSTISPILCLFFARSYNSHSHHERSPPPNPSLPHFLYLAPTLTLKTRIIPCSHVSILDEPKIFKVLKIIKIKRHVKKGSTNCRIRLLLWVLRIVYRFSYKKTRSHVRTSFIPLNDDFIFYEICFFRQNFNLHRSQKIKSLSNNIKLVLI